MYSSLFVPSHSRSLPRSRSISLSLRLPVTVTVPVPTSVHAPVPLPLSLPPILPPSHRFWRQEKTLEPWYECSFFCLLAPRALCGMCAVCVMCVCVMCACDVCSMCVCVCHQHALSRARALTHMRALPLCFLRMLNEASMLSSRRISTAARLVSKGSARLES